MIHPSLENVNDASEEELIAAYLDDGFSEASARAYAATIKHPNPAFPVD